MLVIDHMMHHQGHLDEGEVVYKNRDEHDHRWQECEHQYQWAGEHDRQPGHNGDKRSDHGEDPRRAPHPVRQVVMRGPVGELGEVDAGGNHADPRGDLDNRAEDRQGVDGADAAPGGVALEGEYRRSDQGSCGPSEIGQAHDQSQAIIVEDLVGPDVPLARALGGDDEDARNPEAGERDVQERIERKDFDEETANDRGAGKGKAHAQFSHEAGGGLVGHGARCSQREPPDRGAALGAFAFYGQAFEVVTTVITFAIGRNFDLGRAHWICECTSSSGVGLLIRKKTADCAGRLPREERCGVVSGERD